MIKNNLSQLILHIFPIFPIFPRPCVIAALNFLALWICELFFFCPCLAVKSKLLLERIAEAYPNSAHFGWCRKRNLGRKKEADKAAGKMRRTLRRLFIRPNGLARAIYCDARSRAHISICLLQNCSAAPNKNDEIWFFCNGAEKRCWNQICTYRTLKS